MSTKITEMKIFENKNIVHIVSEVVILLGVVYYFSTKNKKLLTHIEELAQTVDEQEETIEKLQNLIGQLTKRLDNMTAGFIQMDKNINFILGDRQINNSSEYTKSRSVNSQSVKQVVKNTDIEQNTFVDPPRKEQKSKVLKIDESLNQENYTIEEGDDEEEDEEEEDSDLDDEIRDELEELSK